MEWARILARLKAETSAIVKSAVLDSTKFRCLRFCVFGDDHKMRGALEIHKDAILNLGSEFREKIGRRLLALRSQPYRP